MALSTEKSYYKAVRRSVGVVNSSATVKEKLDAIIRGTTRSMKVGASLVLLDSIGRKLIHSYTRGLPQFYLRKGVLDANKSLSEVIKGQPVIITEVDKDDRVQYPELAAKAGIASIMGIPVMLDGQAEGHLSP